MSVTPEEVALAIVRFFREEIEAPLASEALKESLEVAAQCVLRAYELEEKDPKTAADIVGLMSRAKVISF